MNKVLRFAFSIVALVLVNLVQAGISFPVASITDEITTNSDYTSYIANANLATKTDWNTENTKGISGRCAKVSSGANFDFSQTISNLPAGQYKLTAKAVYRYGSDEQSEYDSIQANADTHLAKLYAETATYRYEENVQNRYEGASETDFAEGSDTVKVNDLFVPNSSSAIVAWFKADKYINEVVFNLQSDGNVKIGIAKTAESPACGDYTVIGEWTLTRLGDATDIETVLSSPDSPVRKIVRNGMIIIIKNNKEYNVMGSQIK